MIVVTMRHIRKAKMCSRGARAWFERHGFDWQDFLKNGIDVEKVEATGDVMGIQCAKIARNEAEQ